jgi:hypothetical protein
MDFKKHVDTIVILGAIISSFLWMNGKFNELDNRLTKIETVLIMKNIYPSELAHSVSEERVSKK